MAFSTLRNSTPMKRITDKRLKRLAAWDIITTAAIKAAGGKCLAAVPGICLGRAAVGHHKLLKSQGGQDTQDNCLPTCKRCHGYLHNHPAESYRNGKMVRRTGKVAVNG